VGALASVVMIGAQERRGEESIEVLIDTVSFEDHPFLDDSSRTYTGRSVVS